MKKFLSLCILLLVTVLLRAQDPAYPVAPASAQNITAAEYFIDTDPGVGKAIAVTVTPGMNISNASTQINVNGLSNGVHRLFMRTRNAEGSWSLSAVKDFLYDADVVYTAVPAAAQNIIAAEYFIDTDPGAGAGIAIPITPGLNISNAAAVINTNGLSNGTHRLYIRTRSNEGRWSITNIKEFIVDFDPVYPATPAVAQNIIAAEYFIDTNSGFGSAIPITVSSGTDLNNITTAINTTGLTNGTHRLYLHTKNQEGKWSLTLVKDFIVDADFAYPATPAAAQNIVAAEYFIDTNTGFGAGTPIAISAATDISNIAASINTTGLANGTHRLYVHTKNQEGKWSLTAVKDFIVNADFAYPAAPAAVQNITAAEYFIDTDPGIGKASSITVGPGTDLSNIAVSVNTASLSNGTHKIFIRTRNQEGSWSITARDTFATSLISLSADTVLFGNVPSNTSIIKNLVITNASSTAQTINSIAIQGAFSIAVTTPATINAGQSLTIPITFSPTAAQVYTDSIVLQTSAGRFRSILRGTGINQNISWSIDPAGGHDYGNVMVNSTSNFTFTIRNTGNVAIPLAKVITSNPAFVPVFTAGTIVPVSGSINVQVNFTPAAVVAYSASLKITSATADTVTTSVSGNGYTPGTPPVIQYVTASPYNGNAGVNPAAGQTGLYTYKIVYKSANNRPPLAGYPKVGIDLNGDQDFNDLGEAVYSMTKEGTSTDYATGVVYSYTANYSNYSNTLGYQFFASDDNGNTATTQNVSYKTGPLVTSDVLDLRIFANDISFSKTNPLPGEAFTVTANINNSSDIAATNVPIKFYRDTILIGSDVLASVGAHSSSSVNKTFSFATDGFYPIKVWIDSSNTLGESNILNNYAIRPIIVGAPVLPGGITATTSVSAQQCPQLAVHITGHAVYFGTASPTNVAGAEVTINTGTQLIKTTTDASGNFSYLLTGVTCGGNFTYTVSVTDFTFTSSLVTNSMTLACPAPNACVLPPSQGGMMVSAVTGACVNLVGGQGNVNFVLKYRERDINNMWGLFDEILNDTLRIFQDGVLVQTIGSADNSHGPGNEVIIPRTFPLNSTTPVNITATLSYTYVEYKQIPSSIYHGERTNMSSGGSTTISPEPNLPDLTIQHFNQTGFTAFNFTDANVKCGPAGAHTVKVFDSIPGGASTLVLTRNISALNGGTGTNISFSNNAMTPGVHFIIIVTDSENNVTETDKTNNRFVTSITVPLPDLSVTRIITTPTNLHFGSKATFKAWVKNTGKGAGPFAVKFEVNGVKVGNDVMVNFLDEKDSVQVSSDPYTVATDPNNCAETIRVTADAGNAIIEPNKINNVLSVGLSADLVPYQLPNESGSASNPVVVRVNTTNQFFPAVRNLGQRDAERVTVRFTLNGNWIGADTISRVQAGEQFAAHGAFTRMFDTPGDYTVQVVADTANMVCESNETNNEGSFHIRVTDSKADFEVLSQYISPSSLNPNPGQNISIVGTVRNTGGKVSTPNVLRFMVDDIQLGTDVPINALLPGRDTTVAATALYSSVITGVKVMKIIADPNNAMVEERKDNNVATRTMIVGDAPDLARFSAGAIRFNPSGFVAGDSVNVQFHIKNLGSQIGTAWVKFMIYDESNSLRAIDSLRFTLDAGLDGYYSRKMLFDVSKGMVVTQIHDCTPMEFDLLNNSDTLAFSTVAKLKSSSVVNGNLDMKQALPDMLPGWIGGKLVLGDYDLTINGSISSFDTAHFIVTDGAGKLKLVNNNLANIFPVGPSLSGSNFVKITNTGAADNFSARVAPYVLSAGIGGDTLKAGYVNRTWFLEEQTPGGSNATVAFYWNTPDEMTGFDRSISKTAHFTSAWQLGDIGIAATDSIGRFSKSQDGYTSFSPFTVTSLNASLPLHLLQFTAVKQGSNAVLNWQTTDEVNTSKFIVQHSNNGIGFTDVGTIAANNKPGINNYWFTHAGLTDGIHYYRLRMADIDGRYTYSGIQTVKIENSTMLKVFPNPAKQFVTVRGLEANGTLEILTLDGKLLRQLFTTSNNMTIDVDKLAGGMYIILYKNKDKQQQLKLVKE